VAQDPDAIQRDIEAARAELAAAVDAIVDKVSPRKVAARSTSRARAQVEAWRGPDGILNPDRWKQLRKDRVAIAVAAVSAVAALLVLRSRRRH
jgi:hypothetical protein